MSGELRWENYKKLTKTLMVFMNGKTAIDVSDFMKGVLKHELSAIEIGKIFSTINGDSNFWGYTKYCYTLKARFF